MIDRTARNKLAELIRSLSNGLISNDEFESSVPESDDLAVRSLDYYGAWCLYSDFKEYKLRGKNALSKSDKLEVAHWVLFLKSDIEYDWPCSSIFHELLHCVTFGKFGKSRITLWQKHGDISAWPFISKQQLDIAKKGKGYFGAGHT